MILSTTSDSNTNPPPARRTAGQLLIASVSGWPAPISTTPTGDTPHDLERTGCSQALDARPASDRVGESRVSLFWPIERSSVTGPGEGEGAVTPADPFPARTGIPITSLISGFLKTSATRNSEANEERSRNVGSITRKSGNLARKFGGKAGAFLG